MLCLHLLALRLGATTSTKLFAYTSASSALYSAAFRPPMPCHDRPPPSQGPPLTKNFGQKNLEKISFQNVPNREHFKTSRESVVTSTEMSDDDPPRSPTPPSGPPGALPELLSFAEKQEVISFHPIPSHRHLRLVSALKCPCPPISRISWAYTNSESWRPMGTPLRVPALGHLGHTPLQRVRRLG